MTKPNFKRTKFACYSAYFTMSSIFSLPPLLFVTFKETFGISYTLLGTLVLTNFCTQFAVDLIFTIFSKKFNFQKIVRFMPLITSLGMFVYALIPSLFPNFAYGGLLIGTVIFSVSAGLSEVLLSPTIAAIPSDNPQRDMSLLHSLYGFGVFTVIIISTVFLKIFSRANWAYLVGIFALLPIFASILFFLSPMPDMSASSCQGKTTANSRKIIGITICALCIFLGSCAENTMSNWISSFMENALHIDKAVGDILGMALFAILLALTRICYAKFGKNISRFLLVGMIGASVCYFLVGFSSNVIVAFVGCVLTGIFTSMLWPGTLIMMEEKIPNVGVGAYALMAASGDFGASLAPQLMGIVADNVAVSKFALDLAPTLNLTVEQIGLKAGMLVNSIFPILGIAVMIIAINFFKKPTEEKTLLQND